MQPACKLNIIEMAPEADRTCNDMQRAGAGLAGLILAMLAETVLLIMRTSYPVGARKDTLKFPKAALGSNTQPARPAPDKQRASSSSNRLRKKDD